MTFFLFFYSIGLFSLFFVSLINFFTTNSLSMLANVFKIIALAIFASGVSFVVWYQSGGLSAASGALYTHEESDTQPPRLRQLDSIQATVPPILNEDKTYMYSSKSAPVFSNDVYVNGSRVVAQPDSTKPKEKPKKEKKTKKKDIIVIPSTKSGKVFQPNNDL